MLDTEYLEMRSKDQLTKRWMGDVREDLRQNKVSGKERVESNYQTMGLNDHIV